MGIFSRRKEERSVTQSSSSFLEVFGLQSRVAASGVAVNNVNALGVPAFWAAVNFLSGTLAGLPLHVYKKGENGPERVDNPISKLLNEVPNETMSSFDWRKYSFDQTFTGGRHFSYIERNRANRIVNIWPLNPQKTTIESDGLRKIYKSGGQTYAATEIIDIPFMLQPDMVSHYGPVGTLKNALGMAIAASEFGAKAFQSGGIPPTVLQGPFSSGAAAQRASDDLQKTMKEMAKQSKNVLVMPEGHRMEALGFSPDKMQLLELQRFCVEEVARIFSLPPVFLQDLTRGTFSNTEQQDLHFVKHTVKRWVEQFEQELTLKLFGRSSSMFVAFNVDGLLRGDIKTRMEAHASAIQNGIYSPAHAAKLENAPHRDEAEKLFIQGGTFPIEDAKGQLDE